MNTTTSILIIFPTMVLVTLIKNALANTNQLSRKIRFPFMLMMCCYLVISILAIIFSDQMSKFNTTKRNSSWINTNAFLLTFFVILSIYSIGLSAYIDGKKCSVRYSWTVRNDWDQENDKTKSVDPFSVALQSFLFGTFLVCIVITSMFTHLSFQEGSEIAKALSIISLAFELFFMFYIKRMINNIEKNAKWNFLKNLIQNQINDQNKCQFNLKKISNDANAVYENLFLNIFYSTPSAIETNKNILNIINGISD